MTIGIVLKFTEDKSEGLIFIADKMYTYQGTIGIESDISKIEPVYSNEKKCEALYGIGAGSGPWIRQYFERLYQDLSTPQQLSLSDIFNNIRSILIAPYNEIIKKRIEESVLGPLGIKFEPDKMEQYINNPILFNNINNKISEVWNGLDILIGIQLQNKVAIYNINSSEVNDLTSQGFGVIGSGDLSAMWSLIHLGYSPNNDMKKALTLGLFAKFQAEESHGVGEATDAVILYCNANRLIVKRVDQVVIDNVRKAYDKLLRTQKGIVDESSRSININLD
ncbi:hypothetical protein [Saccharolobus islandicus]|nr:hypothetical protein [Sulfolobus islandicus]